MTKPLASSRRSDAARRSNTSTSARAKCLKSGSVRGCPLKHYRGDLEVTGIDVSGEMLEKAREKVARRGLTNVTGLHEMDARTLDFPDDHFDIVVAMYLVSVVPEPERVVAEMARVCKPGGEVLIVNHFARDRGPLSLAEKALAPFANKIGWHSDFSIHQVLNHDALTMVEQKPLPPLGVFTFLRMAKAS